MKNEKLVLFLLASLQFTNIVDFMIIMPLGPQLMRIFAITPMEFSFIVSAYTISAGVSGFASAFFLDSFDRKKALVTVYFGFIVGTLFCGISDNYIVLMIARVVTGLFGGLMSALVLSIISDLIPIERRSSAMGIVMAAFSAASVLGVPFSIYIADLYTWQVPFYFLAGLGSIIFVFIFKYIPNMSDHKINADKSVSRLKIVTNILSNPNQQKALLLMCVLMLGQFTVIPFIAPYFVKNVGFTETELTWVYLIGGLLTIFTAPFFGKLSDKHGRYRVFKFLAVISLAPLILITQMGEQPLVIALIFSSLFMVFISGRVIPAMTIITSTAKPQNRAGFMSINSSVQQFSAGIASFIAGLIVIEGPHGEIYQYDYVGYFAVAASIVAIFIINKITSVE